MLPGRNNSMKNSYLFISLFLFFACSTDQQSVETQVNPPDSIIPEKQMVLILADAHIIEAALVIERNRGIEVAPHAAFYYAGLFKKFRISRKCYQQNLEYYRDDPDVFLKLYEKVIRELTEREKNFVKSDSP